jgi:threonine synthase
MDYPARAADILSRFLLDFSKEELTEFTAKAYSQAKFAADGVAQVNQLD